MGVEFPNYPLTFTTYWLEYRLWADSPMGYHAVNIVLHAINSALALLLLSRLKLGRRAAFLAAALFAVHPMQVESVAWIAERKNVLFTCFSLLTLLSYIRFRCANHAGWYLLALLSFSAAVLSKTAAVTVPLTMLFTDWYLQKRVSLTRFWGLLPFFVISLIAGLWVCSVEQPPAVPIDWPFRPLLAVSAFCFYLFKPLWPIGLLPIYPMWQIETSPLQLAGVATLCIIVWVGWRFRARIHPIAFWGAGHFTVSLGPFLGLLTFAYLGTAYVADRFFYMAAIGLFAPLSVGIDLLLRRLPRPVGRPAMLGLVVALGLLSALYTQVYRDSIVFWKYTMIRNPDCYEPYNNLGVALQNRGLVRDAMGYYEKALTMSPTMTIAIFNLANCVNETGNYATAELYYRQVLRMRAGFAPAHYNLAYVLQRQNRYEEAIESALTARKLDPNNSNIDNLAGTTYQQMGRLDIAKECFLEAIRKDPSNAMARRNLASLMSETETELY